MASRTTARAGAAGGGRGGGASGARGRRSRPAEKAAPPEPAGPGGSGGQAAEGRFVTDSGFEVLRFYPPAPRSRSRSAAAREQPGAYPFTRGIHAGMYRDRLWTMRQYSGFGDASQTNKRFKFMLEKGQTGLSMAFDLPTQIGYDPDSAQAEGEVGKVGVSISSVRDMMAAFDGIPLGRVSTSMTINSTASTLLAYYIAVGRSQGFGSEQLRGTTQNDILKEYIARNTYIYPPEPSMRIIGDMIGYCAEHVPRWYPVSISGYHMREAGATATQEVAFTMANAIAYVETCLAQGLKIDDFAPRLSFFFCCTMEFFEEVAKFRAARRVYARIVKERFGAMNPRSMQLKFHTQTSGESLTAQQPDNNIVRVAVQSMAAVLGGTQSLHTNSRDEALALPTEESAKIALRTQQIVAHESGITKTADPLGGSHYVESLCEQIEDGVWAYLKKIDSMGGSIRAIERGFFQSEIRRNAYRLKTEIDSGDRVVVGVNRHADESERSPELLRVGQAVERRQKREVRQARRERDGARAEGGPVGPGLGGRHGQEPHAAHTRRRAGARDDRRDQRRPQVGVRRVQAKGGVLNEDRPRGDRREGRQGGGRDVPQGARRRRGGLRDGRVRGGAAGHNPACQRAHRAHGADERVEPHTRLSRKARRGAAPCRARHRRHRRRCGQDRGVRHAPPGRHQAGIGGHPGRVRPPKVAARRARRAVHGAAGPDGRRQLSIILSASEAVIMPTMRALRDTRMHFVKRSSGTSTLAGVS